MHARKKKHDCPTQQLLADSAEAAVHHSQARRVGIKTKQAQNWKKKSGRDHTFGRAGLNGIVEKNY